MFYDKHNTSFRMRAEIFHNLIDSIEYFLQILSLIYFKENIIIKKNSLRKNILEQKGSDYDSCYI